MPKVKMGPQTLLYVMPVFLVGADVDGAPNFMVAAWGGIACSKPPMVSLAIQPDRYTCQGILKNKTLSINIPPASLVKEVDYCGVTSGSRINKVETCKFDIFYGKLGNAPLIEQCPINLECRVVHVLNLGSHSLIISQIEESHVSADCLTDGKVDFKKLDPFVYDREGRQYITLGKIEAKAFSAGLELKAKGEGR